MGTPSATLRRVVEGLERTLARFPEAWSEDAAIAFSGGKDSIALAAALSASGRAARLRAVDMGYSAAWAGRIQEIARTLGLPVDVVSVRELAAASGADPILRDDLMMRRAFLDGPEVSGAAVTPCTNCYNCKILSLVDAAGTQRPTMLFGHHSSDVLSSFLKAALMYIDRWEEGHTKFNRDEFRALCLRYALQMRDGSRRPIDSFLCLLENRRAQTSEPPVERRPLHGRSYTIGRPLFFVSEADTRTLAGELGVRAESSGCGHTAAATTRTPREIIHHELLPLASETDRGRAALAELLDSIAASLRADGTATTDVRNSRHALLGREYKGDGTGPSRRL